eukprot:7576916-Prorocentrum_lima.AAC.1
MVFLCTHNVPLIPDMWGHHCRGCPSMVAKTMSSARPWATAGAWQGDLRQSDCRALISLVD